MTNSFVFDTNAVINYLRDREGLDQFFNGIQANRRKVSFITKVELLIFPSISVGEEYTIREILADCAIIPMNDEIENIAILLGRCARLKAPDAIIAATAVAEKAVLVTDDDRLLNVEWSGFSARSLFSSSG